MRKVRSNLGGIHLLLKPKPCSITQLLKKSKKGKIFTFRRSHSGTRYKQYCKDSVSVKTKIKNSPIQSTKNVNTKRPIQSTKNVNTKPNQKASGFNKGTILQGHQVVIVKKGSGHSKKWKKL